MNWFGEFAVDESGMCCWQEGLRIDDAAMATAYKTDLHMQITISVYAELGVKVGMA
ncbi:MAG TPA: hypothetical protein VEW69_10230 [Alphaproteobacteria bacterium]|jgi:hypothetical protein|nr:hypothetical protein [Alphaproteobacteria bacterium]